MLLYLIGGRPRYSRLPIAEITRQYMRLYRVDAVLQLELRQYLLMAATLAEVKSRMLLRGSAATSATKRILVRTVRASKNTSASSRSRGIDRMARWSAIPGVPRPNLSTARLCALRRR